MPTQYNLTINLSSIENIERITIYNILGQKVINQNLNAISSQLNLANLLTVAYLMQVSLDGKTATYKVLKN
ncbi:MAG: T9SS type A sorting domain-containing protein [Flavobacteriaceae bacterium]|nr:T9SS type A sorting domain-containing protein [Flavobacteriaceae bacterium]